MSDDNIIPIEEAPPERKKPGPKPRPRPVEIVEPAEPVLALGRVIRYITGEGTVRPAMVTKIHSETQVDLTVFNSEGAVPVTGVLFEDAEEDIPGTCHWPDRG